MTIDEFIDQLPRDGWVLERRHSGIGHLSLIRRAPLDPRKSISGPSYRFCPICIVAEQKGLRSDEYYTNGRAVSYGEELGLSLDNAVTIIKAADLRYSSQLANELRARLLAHCNLPPDPKPEPESESEVQS